MIFHHLVTDVSVVVRGDDFTFAGPEVELRRARAEMREWLDVKVRGSLESSKVGSARHGRQTGKRNWENESQIFQTTVRSQGVYEISKGAEL